MVDKDDERLVLERGIGDEWRNAEYVPPLPVRRWYQRLRPRLPDWADYEWARRLRVVVALLVLAALTLLAVQGSVRGLTAEGVSMEPTVHNGDRLIVNRLSYAHLDLGLLNWLPLIDIDARWARPGRGDVIIFHSPVEDRDLLKRVVGMPGETVTITDDGVSIDGLQLYEPYAVGRTECAEACEWTVPSDSYFVLGDNRENSLDSRGGWFVPMDNIAGKELLRY
jgi:signal peptidase I